MDPNALHTARPFPASRPAPDRPRHGLAAPLLLALALAAASPGPARAQDARQGTGPAPVPVPAPAPAPPTGEGPFDRFDLPDDWEARFWADPGVEELLKFDAKALAALVPAQAGVRFCRCPGCDAGEVDDPLAWSILKPKVLTCRRCGATFPNDDVPAKSKDDKKKVPEEVVEVLPHVFHHYPYHEVEAEKQRYPDERIYLDAKRDYEAREFLSKAALYAAVRYHRQPPGSRQPALARLAAILVLRFAQVYPAYATHFDQPDEPKYFQQADLPPPYRRGYRTGKWDWTSNLDVPMNLLIAYALVRSDPALAEAGRALEDPDPSRTIERDLFRASAEFVRLQPEEFSEMSLHAYRGLLAVGRLLDDPALVREALARLNAFAERGFYHDGYWRQGDAAAHRRVVGLIDGWIERLLADPPEPGLGTGPGTAKPGGPAAASVLRRAGRASLPVEVPMLSLARGASAVSIAEPRAAEVQRAAWPSAGAEAVPPHPALLGGAGLARLAVGRGEDALDLELRGLDGRGGPHFQRQAIRLAVAGRPVLSDLDELPPLPDGWDRATACHNTVVVDGLNQRESIVNARTPAPGGHFLFYAADPDFQVVTLEDPQAYPQSTTRYRQTVIAAGTGRCRYAVGVFEVHGGLQHDQIFHAAAGAPTAWQLPPTIPTEPGPDTLLPPSITYVPDARAEDGRWFVQAYGAFEVLGQARLNGPTTALLACPGGPGVRLHLLSHPPLIAYPAASVDPTLGTEPPSPSRIGRDRRVVSRAGLILRRRSEDGATLRTTFVTVYEPTAPAIPPLLRVGRVASTADTVIVYVETAEGVEHLVVNLSPGTARSVTLSDGRPLRTDGLAVRVRKGDLTLAGGSFAEAGGHEVRQSPAAGRIVSAARGVSATGRGYFTTRYPVPEPETLVGRTLMIRHGDGTVRGWTLTRVENAPRKDGARLYVHEEPGFTIDPESGAARYYQFPRDTAPGPHTFHISRIARAPTSREEAGTQRR